MKNSNYKTLSNDELEGVFSKFLIDSWSYSRVTTFARNEKAFEMTSIYREKIKKGASTIAGEAYHEALKEYFVHHPLNANSGRKKTLNIVSLEKIAFEYIDNVKGNDWKLQKTTPTVEDCIKKAYQIATSLLNNFVQEVEIYISNVSEVKFVEQYFNEWLVINGVEIPLPCHAKIDLILLLKDGRTVIVDHKSKNSHTSDDEISLSVGKQASVYVNVFEEKFDQKVDAVWFIENKYSKNRDGSPQLAKFEIEMNDDNRRLFEAQLYEPLRRMIQAVSDPDHVYIMNEQDAFVDQAELHRFWCKTLIGEIEEFNVPDNKKEMVERRLKKVKDASISVINPNVIKQFKEKATTFIQYDLSNSDMKKEERIQHVLRTFGIICEVAHTLDGYSSDTYLLELSAGTKIQAVHSRRLDIANALDVPNVRIMPNLLVYNGKSYVAIESGKKRTKALPWDKSDLQGEKIPVGRDNFGNVIFWDLSNQSTPHALVCGGTGSGKSVWIASTIKFALESVVDELIILDPKYEFTGYSGKNVSVYNSIEEIEDVAESLVSRMNEMIATGQKSRVMVVLDEFADAYLMASKGKDLDIFEDVQDGFYRQSAKAQELGLPAQPKMKRMKVGSRKSLEENIQSLLQKGRSSGFRLILATQRADAKTINGSAKVNLPVQICFRVQKEVDSRVVLDEAGAETLQGQGDGLFRSPDYHETTRFQGYF